jgi:hypothetical protein
MKGWWKKWFYLRNDPSALLPVFTGGRSILLRSWGEGVARKDLGKLQPLLENLQQLWQEGLTGMHLLQMFFSHGMYPGTSCPDRPSSEELSAAEVGPRIHKVLYLGVNPNSSAGPIPLRRGIASVRVSTLGLVLVAFVILSFHHSRDLVQGLGGSRYEPRDATRREARLPSSEET